MPAWFWLSIAAFGMRAPYHVPAHETSSDRRIFPQCGKGHALVSREADAFHPRAMRGEIPPSSSMRPRPMHDRSDPVHGQCPRRRARGGVMMCRCAAALLIGCALAAPARADDVADFYRGRTIALIVGYGPSGGYDLVARMMARHLGRHIPGNPTIVVQNMPG